MFQCSQSRGWAGQRAKAGSSLTPSPGPVTAALSSSHTPSHPWALQGTDLPPIMPKTGWGTVTAQKTKAWSIRLLAGNSTTGASKSNTPWSASGLLWNKSLQELKNNGKKPPVDAFLREKQIVFWSTFLCYCYSVWTIEGFLINLDAKHVFAFLP